ncbi:hypothetical protein [Microbulbifer epialgicus]|uniref:Uncharacterized protein n=1 Tax=Microbulbifer epialgicus TaxID=393907 RepID=A0ABV4P5W0_9GAMM
MRKILMPEKGEFRKQGKFDYIRSAAMKLLASNIKENKGNKNKVVVLKALPK